MIKKTPTKLIIIMQERSARWSLCLQMPLIVWANLFKYSPDGTRLAYLMNFDTTEDVPIPGGRLVMSDSSGKNPKFLNTEYLPISDYDWSPGRGRHCCGCSRCAWQLFGEKRL